jgi:hypothetical protein
MPARAACGEEMHSAALRRDNIFGVSNRTETDEACVEAATEVVRAAQLVRVVIRREVGGVPQHCNGLLEVAEIAEVLETRFECAAEVHEECKRVMIGVQDERNDTEQCRNRALEVDGIGELFGTGRKGGGEIVDESALSGWLTRMRFMALCCTEIASPRFLTSPNRWERVRK